MEAGRDNVTHTSEHISVTQINKLPYPTFTWGGKWRVPITSSTTCWHWRQIWWWESRSSSRTVSTNPHPQRSQAKSFTGTCSPWTNPIGRGGWWEPHTWERNDSNTDHHHDWITTPPRQRHHQQEHVSTTYNLCNYQRQVDPGEEEQSPCDLTPHVSSDKVHVDRKETVQGDVVKNRENHADHCIVIVDAGDHGEE